jgi:membrane-associated phospholipid phosphatase
VKHLVVASAVAFAAVLTPGVAHAEDEPHPKLRYDLRTDFSATFTLFALSLGSELAKKDLAPASCRLCDRSNTAGFNVIDQPVRDALRWNNPQTASTLSDIGLVFLPLGVLSSTFAFSALEGHPENGLVDVAIIAEAASAAIFLTQIAKFTFGRERPFVHALSPEEKPRTSSPADNNLSFFSGHTALAFACATAGGTIASMRHYSLAPVVWAVGLTLATASGYLRIAADRHYFSDVLVGAGVGALVGVAVPALFHGPDRSATDTARTAFTGHLVPYGGPGNGGVSFSGTF